MTPDEHAAALCGIAYSALMFFQRETQSPTRLGYALAEIRNEIARLRGQTTEEVQREFEGKATS